MMMMMIMMMMMMVMMMVLMVMMMMILFSSRSVLGLVMIPATIFAVKHMVAICNDICLRRPSGLAGALDGLSPNSLWYGSKLPPSSRLLRGGPLFCLCFAVIYKPQRAKGSDRARPAVYMGIDNHASYVVRDLATGKIFHSADLVFKSNVFPYRPSFSLADGLADQTLGILDHAPPVASEFLALPSVDPTPVIPFHESAPQSGGG